MPVKKVTYDARIVPHPGNWDGIVRVTGKSEDVRIGGICVPIRSSSCNVGQFFFYGTALQFASTFQIPSEATRDPHFLQSLSLHYDRPSFIAGVPVQNQFRGRYLHISRSELQRLLGASSILDAAEDLARVPGKTVHSLVEDMVVHQLPGGLRETDYVGIIRDNFPRFPRTIIEAAKRRGKYGIAHKYNGSSGEMTRKGQLFRVVGE